MTADPVHHTEEGVPTPALVISDPPHGEFDAARAAPLLGLHPVDLSLKARYGIPEIWLAPPSRSEAETAARDLRAAGLHVAVALGDDLATIPAQALVEDVGFGASGLSVIVKDTELNLPYELPAVGVLCAPREEKEKGLPAEGTGAWGTFLDVFVPWPGGVRRFGMVQGVTDCSSVDEGGLLTVPGRFLKCVSEFETRFPKARVDRRLTHLQLRRRHVGGPYVQQRKGFSYATPALNELLRSLAPGGGLEDISQPELCSRLVYLTQAAPAVPAP